jgi:hypothetical protein
MQGLKGNGGFLKGNSSPYDLFFPVKAQFLF